MRVLVVGRSPRAMARLRRRMAATWPEIEVTEYDADLRGEPDPAFDASIYALAVLLEPAIGEDEAWLGWFTGRSDAPPAIVIAAELDPYRVARVMRAGARGVLLDRDVDTERLFREVDTVLVRGAALPDAPTLVDPARIVASLRGVAPTGPSDTASGEGTGYRFVRLIGQGGMSRVYLAKRSTDDMLIVVKTMAAHLVEDDEMRERFLAEAELARTVPREHAVEVYDYGFGNHYGMIAMEFLPLGDLKRRIEGGVDTETARRFLLMIARALEALSGAGIVHRDLKPGNLMFRADGNLVLADFGIAKRLGAAAELDTTQGRVLGTPAYISPEQARGLDADVRSDLYSAGVIFYEMLSGTRPFTGPSIEALMYQHVNDPVPPLPLALASQQSIVDALLAKNPDHRLGDPSALVRLLEGG